MEGAANERRWRTPARPPGRCALNHDRDIAGTVLFGCPFALIVGVVAVIVLAGTRTLSPTASLVAVGALMVLSFLAVCMATGAEDGELVLSVSSSSPWLRCSPSSPCSRWRSSRDSRFGDR